MQFSRSVGKKFKNPKISKNHYFDLTSMLDVHEEEYLAYFKWKDEFLLYDDNAYCQLW